MIQSSGSTFMHTSTESVHVPVIDNGRWQEQLLYNCGILNL